MLSVSYTEILLRIISYWARVLFKIGKSKKTKQKKNFLRKHLKFYLILRVIKI